MPIDPLSKPVRTVYRRVRVEVIRLHFRWKLFNRLYRTDQATVDLLMDSSGYFFNQLYYDLLDAISLSIIRLLDPSELKGLKNANMNQLIDLLEGINPDLQARLREHLANANENAKRIRRWRNKIPAHLDYSATINPNSKPGFNPQEVDNTLAELGNFVNEFERCYSDPAYIHDSTAPIEEQRKRVTEFEDYKIEITQFDKRAFPGDGDDLIRILKKGLEKLSE